MILRPGLIFFMVLCVGLLHAQGSFEIVGHTGKQLEGKKIILSNHYTDYSGQENKIQDSAIIKKGRFYFSGSLKNQASFVSLFLQRPGNGLQQFFIENRKINLFFSDTKKSNLLDSFRFENAPVAIQQKELERSKTDYYKRFKTTSEKAQALYAGDNDSLKASLDNEMRLLRKEETDLTIDFIKKHPSYYVSMFWFCYHVTDRTIYQPDSTLALFKQLSPDLQQLPEAQSVLKQILTKIDLIQHKNLPAFSIPDTEGKLVSSADFKNKYLLIDFWASWCGPCIADIPELKKTFETYHNKGLSVLSISLDDNKERWITAVKRYQLPWQQVSELTGWKGSFAKKLDIRFIPQYYLAGPDGKFLLSGVSLEQVNQFMNTIPQ